MNSNLSPQMIEAIEELKEIILKEYPEATFNVTEGEDAGSVHLCPTIDVIETDAILDLVMDRVLAFQEEKGLDIHVIPLRTRQREAEYENRDEPPAPSGRLKMMAPPGHSLLGDQAGH